MTSFRIHGLRLVSLANAREHWRIRQRRAKAHRAQARLLATAALRGNLPALPLVVTITRIGPRRLDSDNLAISAKHVRDGVADALGLDDGDPQLVWLYDQRSDGKGVYACEVTIAPGARQSAPQTSGAVSVRPANENAPEVPSRPGKRYPRRQAATGGKVE